MDTQTLTPKLIDVTIDACSKSPDTGWMPLRTTAGEAPIATDQKVAAHLLEELFPSWARLRTVDGGASVAHWTNPCSAMQALNVLLDATAPMIQRRPAAT